jgi:hypothetical protein
MPRYSRKKRGGGCVNSNCTSQPTEVNDASLEEDFDIVAEKLMRYFNSKISRILNDENAAKIGNLSFNILTPIYNEYRYNGLNKPVYIQRYLEAYNNFRIQEPELSRVFDLPLDILNLDFDDEFHDRGELKTYLLQKEPAIFNLINENALNRSLDNLKLKSQHIPQSQELGGGRRKKTTRKRKSRKKNKTARKRRCGGGVGDVIINPMW